MKKLFRSVFMFVLIIAMIATPLITARAGSGNYEDFNSDSPDPRVFINLDYLDQTVVRGDHVQIPCMIYPGEHTTEDDLASFTLRIYDSSNKQVFIKAIDYTSAQEVVIEWDTSEITKTGTYTVRAVAEYNENAGEWEFEPSWTHGPSGTATSTVTLVTDQPTIGSMHNDWIWVDDENGEETVKNVLCIYFTSQASSRGTAAFQISRKDKDNGWKTLCTIGTTLYEDQDIKGGVYYTYRVRTKWLWPNYSAGPESYSSWSKTYSIYADPFMDVAYDESSDQFLATMWGVRNGTVKGTEPGYFSPNDTCTRGQVATMLYRMNGSPKVNKPAKSPFADVKLTDGYFKAIYWAYKEGIISGYTQNGKTYFKPKDACTRGQIATLLWKMAGKPEPVTTTNPYKDVKKSDGYYKAILWLGEKGIAKGKKGMFMPKDPCKRSQIVYMLYKYDKVFGLVE